MSISTIGLPELSKEDLARLTEECESKITQFILKTIPPKSISDLNVVCSIDLSDVLTLDIELDITQAYDTGHSLDEVLELAAQHAQDWLEHRLLEMKSK